MGERDNSGASYLHLAGVVIIVVVSGTRHMTSIVGARHLAATTIPNSGVTRPPPGTPSSYSHGALIGGAYRVVTVLGCGGMSVVVAATRLADEMPVAVKFAAVAEAPLEMVLRGAISNEAAVLRRISSAGVPPLLDYGEDETVGPFLVLPLLRGATVADLVCDAPYGAAEALVLVEDILTVLCDVHRAGVIHGDIKPTNIWVGARSPGSVTLIDYGLATHPAVRLTRDVCRIAGTPGYIAPERKYGREDPRSDLFAVAATILAAMDAECFDELCNSALSAGLWLESRGFSAASAALIAYALEANPNDRPTSAAAMLRELRAQ